MLPNLFCITKYILAHYSLRKQIQSHERLEKHILALKVTEKKSFKVIFCLNVEIWNLQFDIITSLYRIVFGCVHQYKTILHTI